MANNKGAVAFLAVIAIGALGLSGYMFTMDLLSKEGDKSNLRVVAVWNDLDGNTVNNPNHTMTNDFLVEFSNASILEEEYVSAVNSTRFTLAKVGMYKISLSVLWAGLDPGGIYYIKLLKNDEEFEYFDYFRTASPVVSSYKYTYSSIFINNTNPNDFYVINAKSTIIGFLVYVTSYYNQLTIEYVVN